MPHPRCRRGERDETLVRVMLVLVPRLVPEEVFEDRYTELFKQQFVGKGIQLSYTRDRAATDLGFHLTRPGSLELSGVKVWFQLKGIQRATLPEKRAHEVDHVTVSVRLEDLRFWYAAPEAIYLIVYVEALDCFLAEDVRDVVDRQWGPDFLTAKFASDQQSVTAKVATSALLDEARIGAMLRHQSMRIDGPGWRGRPLGHKLDPLRCELAPMAPSAFTTLVLDLLAAHDFRVNEKLDASALVGRTPDDSALLLFGTLHNTWEWIFQGSVEFGFDEGSEFRIEGQVMHAQGPVGILIHSPVNTVIELGADAPSMQEGLRARGAEQLLVFSNASDLDVIGPYRLVAGDLYSLPQGLGSLAFNLLVATLVYLRHRDHVSWRYVNYR